MVGLQVLVLAILVRVQVPQQMKSNTENIIKEVRSKIENLLNVKDVSVIFLEKPEKTIPETGVGGFTPDSNIIYIYTDSANKNFDLKELKHTFAHEFHHAVRNRYHNWKKDSLFGAIVTEGLADHFDLEVNGGEPHLWSVALNEEKLAEVLKLAELEFNNKSYDHASWFFGNEKVGIPKWAGYALGFKIVGDYLQKTGRKASELVDAPSELFK